MQNPSSQPLPDTAPQRVAVSLPTPKPYVTYALLAILVVIFFAQMVTNQLTNGDNPRFAEMIDPITIFGAQDFQAVLHGEYYRLFTAMFLHLNLAHLIFNGMALWLYGRIVESFFGHVRFVIIYLLGGLTCSLASFFLTRGSSVGASGAIFAIFAAEMVFLFQNRKTFGENATRELRYLLILAALNLSLGIFNRGPIQIDNWGHIGGFVGGCILTWFMAPQFSVQQDANMPGTLTLADANPLSKTWMIPLAFIVVLVVIFVFGLSSFQRLA